jgi:acyl-ACP thioesterase
MYEYQLQIGISHIGTDSLLKLGAMMDILQNATWFQLDTETAFIEYFRANHAGMYLISRQIDILRLPAYGEHITVKSWVQGCDRLYGYRNTAIYDENNKLCIGTYATGAFVDIQRAMPSRISQELVNKIVSYPPLDMEILPRKIPVPPELSDVGPLVRSDTLRPHEIAQSYEAVRVQSYHLDYYGHMNNARYVDIASAYIPEDFPVRRMRAEYKRMALPGDLIVPHFCQVDDSTIVITLNAEDGHIFTVMEFKA